MLFQRILPPLSQSTQEFTELILPSLAQQEPSSGAARKGLQVRFVMGWYRSGTHASSSTLASAGLQDLLCTRQKKQFCHNCRSTRRPTSDCELSGGNYCTHKHTHLLFLLIVVVRNVHRGLVVLWHGSFCRIGCCWRHGVAVNKEAVHSGCRDLDSLSLSLSPPAAGKPY